MLPKPELAYFAIADISGYTSFLAGVELDHAQDIIADFIYSGRCASTTWMPQTERTRVNVCDIPQRRGTAGWRATRVWAARRIGALVAPKPR